MIFDKGTDQIDDLLEAIASGNPGWELVIKSLYSDSKQLQEAAYLLLQENQEPKAKAALEEYEKSRLKLLQEQIEKAFTAVKYPGDKKVAVQMDLDNGLAGQYFSSKKKRGHTVESLLKFNYALIVFSPEVFQYYLPVYLLAVLEAPEAAIDLHYAIISVFDPQDRKYRESEYRDDWKKWLKLRLELFSQEQLRALIAYLEYSLFSFNLGKERAANRAIAFLSSFLESCH